MGYRGGETERLLCGYLAYGEAGLGGGVGARTCKEGVEVDKSAKGAGTGISKALVAQS